MNLISFELRENEEKCLFLCSHSATCFLADKPGRVASVGKLTVFTVCASSRNQSKQWESPERSHSIYFKEGFTLGS